MFFWKKEQPTTSSIVTAGVIGGIVGGAGIYYACHERMSSASNAPPPAPAPLSDVASLAHKCTIHQDKYKKVQDRRAELSTAQKQLEDKKQDIEKHIRDNPGTDNNAARNLMYQQLGGYYCNVCEKKQALKEAEEEFDKASV